MMEHVTTIKIRRIVLLFFTIFLFGYVGQAQTLGSLYNLQQQGDNQLYIEKGTELKSALEKVEEHYNVGLLYRSNIVEGLTVRQAANLSLNVEEALSFLLKGTDLRFKSLNPKTYGIYKNTVVIPQVIETAVQQNISGMVTDAETGEPLPGVNVIVAGSEEATGSTIGTTTDMDGFYEIQVPEGLNTLVFSYIGYLRAEIDIDGRSEINVELVSDVQMLEDIVVVGYGTQQRQDITGAIRQIAGRELQNQPAVQTSAALMGALPGVQVQQNSGQPGANQGTIRIRGIGTLGNANPLVLIDGVEGNLDDVASSDIESLTVLKDASAAAVYGSRAANGVILVTTKRGLEDGIQLNYRAFAGIQSATDQPTFVDAGTFMRLENEGATNLDKSPIWSESFISEWEANHQTDPDRFPNTDWISEFFSETAYQQSHHLDILGGTERIRYMGSLSFDDEEGEIPNFDFQRYNLRLNTDVTATDKINLSFDLNVQRNDHKQPGINLGGDQFAVYRVPPIYASQYSHGGWGPGWNNDNPVAFVNDGGLERRQTNKIRGRLNVDFQPIENLQFNLMYAPDYETFFVRRMTKQFSVSSPESAEEIVARHPAQNSLTQNLNNQFSNNFNFTGEYQVNFKNHNFRTLAGFEYVDFRNDFFTAFRDNFPLQDFEQLNAGSADNMQNSGSAAEWAIASFFGRINYDFKNRYLFEANVRYDGSSRFVPDNRWGVFPSFSAGWMISEERFMDNIGFINSFKIRASWGRLGNQQIGNYPFASVINLGQPYIFGGSTATGGAQLDLSNENITWETSTSSNIGVDLAFLEDQIFLHFDYFHRETEDILLQLPVPQIIGLNAPFQNAGVVENVGWELEAGYSGFVGNDFSYRIAFNLSDVKNEVTDLRGAGPFISGNSIIKEGDPINSIWGFESDGLFQSQAEIDAHATQTGDIAPGDIRYVDQNDDGTINADDRVVLGDNFPNLNFGINLSANYKSVDVSAFIQGVGSRDVLLQGNAVWPLWNAGKVRDWHAEDYWTPENPDAFTPRLTQATTHSNFQASDYWVFDASYLRLRNLQVGYTLPKNFSRQLGLRGARVFFLGQNLFTLTRSFPDSNGMPPGVDPNVPSGTTGQYYPVTRLFSAGIDINF